MKASSKMVFSTGMEQKYSLMEHITRDNMLSDKKKVMVFIDGRMGISMKEV